MYAPEQGILLADVFIIEPAVGGGKGAADEFLVVLYGVQDHFKTEIAVLQSLDTASETVGGAGLEQIYVQRMADIDEIGPAEMFRYIRKSNSQTGLGEVCNLYIDFLAVVQFKYCRKFCVYARCGTYLFFLQCHRCRCTEDQQIVENSAEVDQNGYSFRRVCEQMADPGEKSCQIKQDQSDVDPGYVPVEVGVAV